MRSNPRVTIIMRSKNCDWVIGQALAGLFSQSYTNFELMVVDSGSTDRTLDIVRKYPVRLIQIDPKSYIPGVVLNDAIRASETDIVVFQNADVVPTNTEALAELVAAFEDPEICAAYARQVPRPEADTWVRRDYASSFPETGAGPEWITLSLPFAAMRKTVWEKQPFYEEAWGSEDTEWGVRAKAQGWKIAYVPTSIVMHSHNYTTRQMFGRQFIEGEADAFIYGGKETLPRMAARTVISTLRDVAECTKRHDLRGLLMAPALRAAGSWGRYRGHRLGEKRRLEGSKDVSLGQSVVLSRHESVRSDS